MKGLMIYRRDFRTVDNTALLNACKMCDEVYTIFVFTPEQVTQKNKFKSEPAIAFMIGALQELSKQLSSNSGNLFTYYGENPDIIEECIKKWHIDSVFWNKDYTPYAKKRDSKIEKLCSKLGVQCHISEDYYLHAPCTIFTGSGTPYLKYTPYMNKAFAKGFPKPSNVKVKNLAKRGGGASASDLSLTKAYKQFVGEKMDDVEIPESYQRSVALAILRDHREFKDYNDTRNNLTDETTRLSAPIKFGVVSIREVAEAFKKNRGLLRQLVWRDFYAQILATNPEVLGSAMKEQYNKLKWIGSLSHFNKWCDGKTGFPIVDAGMRQLNETGYMHNRTRLITASFLIKTLLVDWQKGEKYFAQHLVDYDPASNNGNWQWVASTGADSQPYFRIFNPWSQGKEHDPEAEYVKKWIPELREVPVKAIHKWDECWTLFRQSGYPKPIVDYKKQKEKALDMYKAI